MALVVKDRIKETSTTSGTGTLTLAGAASGFRSFADVGNANTTYYAIVDSTAGTWEVGIGTYTSSGTTLSRDTVLSNSSGNTSAINFAANSKDVFVTYPSAKSVYLDASDNANISGNLYFNSGFGSAGIAYACRAWVTFDGTASGSFPGGTSTVTRVAGSTTATVTTTTAHGLVTGGTVQALTGVAAGTYTVTYISATQFSFTTVATTALTNASITFGVNSIFTSGNVSSVADVGVGRYGINFTTAMPDANYVLAGTGGNITGTTTSQRSVTRDGAWTTGSCLIRALASSTATDDTYTCVAFFR